MPEKASEKAVSGMDNHPIFDFDIRDAALLISKKDAESKAIKLGIFNEHNIVISK